MTKFLGRWPADRAANGVEPKRWAAPLDVVAVAPLVRCAASGGSATVFAYGQTGSGKTFTMEGAIGGDGSELGIIPRSVERLFEVRDRMISLQGWQFDMQASQLEIYNENIHDLLVEKPVTNNGSTGSSKKTLEVRQSAEGNVVPGLLAIPVYSIEEVLTLMDRGASNRAVGSHDMNEHPSDMQNTNCRTPISSMLRN